MSGREVGIDCDGAVSADIRLIFKRFLVFASITAHVESSVSDNRFQSAYRRGYSTETAITRLLNDVYLDVDC